MVARVLFFWAALPHLTAEGSEGEEAKPLHCAPKTDPHGVWRGSTSPGGEYVLTCAPGYAVEGQQSVTLTCSEQQVQWPAAPWCEDVDDCAKLIYGCGPAGLCVDHVGYSECLCELGAVVHNASHGEVVCYFRNETKHCGGRNCGAHGICVDLTQYQDSFDTGVDSFRCSCEHGFFDDGSTCIARDCGPGKDPLGTWSGSTSYLGEYTLECDEGAFLWGGSQQAITITCPADGVWKLHPACLSPDQLARDAGLEKFRFWANVCMAFVCIACAALAAGLTLGLVSLDPREMQIIQRARLEDCSSQEEKDKLVRQKSAARHILPVLKDHHLLLVTLLLLNALANEALPIFLDELMPPLCAVLLSVTFVLLCGEIIPSAIFTGPMQLKVAEKFIPCVKLLQCVLWVMAKPIAVALDRYLPHEREQLYSRPEIRAVLSLHSARSCDSTGACVDAEEGMGQARISRTSSASTPGSSRRPLLVADCCLAEEPREERGPPLCALEAELCLGALRLGEMRVAFCEGFRTLRVCASCFHPAGEDERVAEAIEAAAAEGKEAVVIFRNFNPDRVKWPVEVPLEDLLGVRTLAELLAEAPLMELGGLCAKPRAEVQAEDTVVHALQAIADADAASGGSPSGFAVVTQQALVDGAPAKEFGGLLEGGRVLLELLGPGRRQEAAAPRPLSAEVSQAVGDAMRAVSASAAPKCRLPAVPEADSPANSDVAGLRRWGGRPPEAGKARAAPRLAGDGAFPAFRGNSEDPAWPSDRSPPRGAGAREGSNSPSGRRRHSV